MWARRARAALWAVKRPFWCGMQALDPRADVPGAGALEMIGGIAMLSPDLQLKRSMAEASPQPLRQYGLGASDPLCARPFPDHPSDQFSALQSGGFGTYGPAFTGAHKLTE